MKFFTYLFLSTVCLSYSAASSAEDELLVPQCAEKLGFQPIVKDTDRLSIEGGTVKSYSTTDPNLTIYRVESCLENIFRRKEPKQFTAAEWMELPLDKKREIYRELNRKATKAYNEAFTLEDPDIIVDKHNKIQYFFHIPKIEQPIKVQSREELCADLKGKYDTHPRDSSIKVDRYAFCMGTQVHQGPTCKNSHGDPCGTQYDKSRAGYTIKKD
ncbi:hypothetical protein Q5X48_09450 [Acinetobacter baumannii]|nr:hypothetical protein [Acinetobacter baumannii]